MIWSESTPWTPELWTHRKSGRSCKRGNERDLKEPGRQWQSKHDHKYIREQGDDRHVCHQRGSPRSITCAEASLPRCSSNCRNQLTSQTHRAYRCSSARIIPLQIIILCTFTLHLTFQSVLITCIISSPSCLQSRNQLSKTETTVTTVNCKVHISIPNNSLQFPLCLTFQRAFKGSII